MFLQNNCWCFSELLVYIMVRVNLGLDGLISDDIMSLFNMKQWISSIIWNKTLALISSAPVHSCTDPILTPTARLNMQQARTPPAPALHWNCSKAVKTPSFSHSFSPCPQRVLPKHTNKHTHTQHTHRRKTYRPVR